MSHFCKKDFFIFLNPIGNAERAYLCYATNDKIKQNSFENRKFLYNTNSRCIRVQFDAFFFLYRSSISHISIGRTVRSESLLAPKRTRVKHFRRVCNSRARCKMHVHAPMYACEYEYLCMHLCSRTIRVCTKVNNTISNYVGYVFRHARFCFDFNYFRIWLIFYSSSCLFSCSVFDLVGLFERRSSKRSILLRAVTLERRLSARSKS